MEKKILATIMIIFTIGTFLLAAHFDYVVLCAR